MKDIKMVTPHTQEDRFNSELAHFVYFIESEVKRKHEEDQGATRIDGGTKMCCVIYLKALIDRIKNDEQRMRAINQIMPVEYNGDPYVNLPKDTKKLFIVRGDAMFCLDLNTSDI